MRNVWQWAKNGEWQQDEKKAANIILGIKI